MKRVKILLFDSNKGFKKLSVTEKQVKLLLVLQHIGKLKGIEFFDMREISPIEERSKVYMNIGNVDFSFYRLLYYFKEELLKVRIIFNDGYEILEYATIDRLNFLKEDMNKRQEYLIKIEQE